MASVFRPAHASALSSPSGTTLQTAALPARRLSAKPVGAWLKTASVGDATDGEVGGAARGAVRGGGGVWGASTLCTSVAQPTSSSAVDDTNRERIFIGA